VKYPDSYEAAARGVGFTEGPVVRMGGEQVAFVSMSTGRVLQWSESGGVTLVGYTGGGPNGLAEDRDGRIYVAQAGGKHPGIHDLSFPGGVQVIEPTGQVRWLTRDPVGGSDICFGPDGYLYLTDATRSRLIDDARIWRVDPVSGEATLLLSVDYYANGLGFGPEPDRLYVASTRDGRILRYRIGEHRLTDAEVVVQLDHNLPDGFAFGDDGSLVVGTVSRTERPGDIQVWSPGGDLVHCLPVADTKKVTNVALTEDRTLYATIGDDGYLAVVRDWPVAGLALYPFRAN
jgi:gluconolactonase